MVFPRRRFLAACLGVPACGRRKAEGFPGHAFIANLSGGAVAVVDLSAFTTARHIRLAGNPAQVLRHPAAPLVYALTTAPAAIDEIDAGGLELRRRARVRGAASLMAIHPDGSALWLLCPDARELVRVDTGELQTGARIRLPARPFDLDISPDGRQAAVSFGTEGLVGLVDLDVPRVAAMSKTGRAATLVRYRKDGRLVIAADPESRRLSLLDAGSGGLVVHLPLAVTPRNFCFKPDGGQLFVTGEGLDAVVTVYPFETQIASTTLAGRAPGAMAACDDPPYLFVANPETGDVTVLNIDTQRVIAVVTVGRHPCHISITPDNRYALVLNRDSGDLSVIRIETLSRRRRRFAPLFMMVPVGSEPVSAVVTRV